MSATRGGPGRPGAWGVAALVLAFAVAPAQEDPRGRWREALSRWTGANEEQRGFLLSDLKFAEEEARRGLGELFESAAAAACTAAEARPEAVAAECRARFPDLRRKIRDLLDRMPSRGAVDFATGPGREMKEALAELDRLSARPEEWAAEHVVALGPDAPRLGVAAEVLDALAGGLAWAERWREVRGRLRAALPATAVLEHRDVNRFAEENRRVREGNQRIGADLPEAARAIVAATNDYREAIGVRLLTLEPRLTAAAGKHSEEMTARNYFSHRSPVRGRTDVGDRISLEGVRTTIAGENIARGSFTPAEILAAWRDSPGHHRNLIDARFRFIGAARDGKYWTAVYAGEMR